MMLKGMTTEYLIRRTYRVKRGDTVLFHAAAGGVGLIACQWLKHLGATVIGTVGSDEKARLAKRHGCDYAINWIVVKNTWDITETNDEWNALTEMFETCLGKLVISRDTH